MKTKDKATTFTAGLCTGLLAATLGFGVLALTVNLSTPVSITENKEANLISSESKVTSIGYELNGVESTASKYSETYFARKFKGVAIDCTTLLRHDCGVGSKKDAETLIKVLQKSIELGWVD